MDNRKEIYTNYKKSMPAILKGYLPEQVEEDNN